ncbi:MAG: hypothetical protein M5U05_18795 [Anaerolineales bacterium]|nr:hypothetical protein [Anaerolineales bacterium]
MSIQDREPPRRLTPAEEFGLTEHERLFDRVSHERFLEFLDDPNTKVHRIEESTNSFGEYLFVTFSRPGKQKRIFMTFYGLGYHEYREKWITDVWNWYQSVRGGELENENVPRQVAKQQIEERYHEMQGYARRDTQTRRGRIFELIADFTDEDGAWAEMQDLPGWLLDEEEDEDLR